MNNKVSGHIKITSKAIGYLPVEGVEEDIEIQTHLLKTALNDDEVEVELLPPVKGVRQQGQVVKIIKRNKMSFVGVADKDEKGLYLIADDKRLYKDILIDPTKTNGAQHGDKIFVRIAEWKDVKSSPVGEVLRVLGKKGVHDVEMQSIVLEKGFDTDFPPEVEEEAKRASEIARANFAEEVKKRKDFRDTATFTIDPVDAKDFDDAISFKELPNGDYEIGVHIADVSHFVTEGSVLDKEARKRGFSVYLVDRTIPMLPEILSNDMCSLNPHEDKFAFSSVFVMTKDAKIKERWFGKTIINSNKRFAYENAQETINSGGSMEWWKELDTLNKIAKIMQEERKQNGAIDFETEEVRFELDEKGVPIRVYKKARLDTHKLVEEYMLLANREVAQVVFEVNEKSKKGEAFVYRIHPEPNSEKIANLAIFLKALGFELKQKDGNVSAKDISAMLKKVEGSSSESLIKTATLRSMAKAIYSTRNIGHFGLGFEYYTHFTSPIRRYPDLIVHRLLQRQLTKGKVEQNEFEKYEKISMEASEQEISAAEAERASIKYKQVEYMSSRIGQEFEGTISGISEWGIYIEETETKCEGMAKIRDMKDDTYELDEKNYSLIGTKTGKKYSLGDKVKFKVTNADLDRKTLDFILI
ncbi:MAG: ribonuclease R [Candidatus Paceibacterota bacterium]